MLELGRSEKVTFLLGLLVFVSGFVGTGGTGAFRLGCTLVLGWSAGSTSTRRGGRTGSFCEVSWLRLIRFCVFWMWISIRSSSGVGSSGVFTGMSEDGRKGLIGCKLLFRLILRPSIHRGTALQKLKQMRVVHPSNWYKLRAFRMVTTSKRITR